MAQPWPPNPDTPQGQRDEMIRLLRLILRAQYQVPATDDIYTEPPPPLPPPPP